MALVLCPECGKRVSNRASVCPSCGFPMYESSNPAIARELPLFAVAAESDIPQTKRWAVSACLRVSQAEVDDALNTSMRLLKTRLSLDAALSIQKDLRSIGVYTKVLDRNGNDISFPTVFPSKASRPEHNTARPGYGAAQAHVQRRAYREPLLAGITQRRNVFVGIFALVGITIMITVFLISHSSSSPSRSGHQDLSEPVAVASEKSSQRRAGFSSIGMDIKNAEPPKTVSDTDPYAGVVQTGDKSKQECVAYIQKVYDSNGIPAEIWLDGCMLMVKNWCEGMNEVNLPASTKDEKAMEAWNELKEGILDASVLLRKEFLKNGHDDVWVCIGLVSDTDHETPLFVVWFDTVWYDVVDGIDLWGDKALESAKEK